MSFGNPQLIEHYQQSLRLKKSQLAETEALSQYFKKFLLLMVKANIENYYLVMRMRRLNGEIQELSQLLENLETQSPINHSYKESFKHLFPQSSNTEKSTKKSSHLSVEQRRHIQEGIAQGKSNAQIAREIGVHRSTVGREIQRNAENRENYQAEDAQEYAYLNQRLAHSLRRFESPGMEVYTLLQKRDGFYPFHKYKPCRSRYIPIFYSGGKHHNTPLYDYWGRYYYPPHSCTHDSASGASGVCGASQPYETSSGSESLSDNSSNNSDAQNKEQYKSFSKKWKFFSPSRKKIKRFYVRKRIEKKFFTTEYQSVVWKDANSSPVHYVRSSGSQEKSVFHLPVLEKTNQKVVQGKTSPFPNSLFFPFVA
jgi:hypothetical protein